MSVPGRTVPELLAPAGSMDKLVTALAYGADAVYLGGESMSLRPGHAGFAEGELPKAFEAARRAGARVYFLLNAFARPGDMAGVERGLELAAQLGADGLVAADPGVVALALRRAPDLPVHLSTQAHTVNGESVAFWGSMGVKRVNLARELSLADMRLIAGEVRERGLGVELEAFVHGAMCLSLSGRCLLSAWMCGRDANQGRCAQPCRFEYRRMVFEEKLRAGEAAIEVVSGEGFSEIFAPHDLCLAACVPALARAGLAALKIEGRTKSPVYLARVVSAYRAALDDWRGGDFKATRYLSELRAAANRPLSTGFFFGDRRTLWEPRDAEPPLARMEAEEGAGTWRVSVRGRWSSDMAVEALLPGLKRLRLTPGGYALENERGEAVSLVNPGMAALVRVQAPAPPPGAILLGALKAA